MLAAITPLRHNAVDISGILLPTADREHTVLRRVIAGAARAATAFTVFTTPITSSMMGGNAGIERAGKCQQNSTNLYIPL